MPMVNFSDAIKNGLKSFLEIRFQPSVDLLVVSVSYLVMVAGLYTTWTKFTIVSGWVPVSMFILGVLVPIVYNNLVKKRPLSETGISGKYWRRSLILGLVLSVPILIRPTPVNTLSFSGLFPLVVFEITAGLFLVIFFCGWVQMRFERAFGAIPAIVMTAVLFALHHVAYGEPISVLLMLHFMGGLVYSVVFRLTRNVFILWPFLALVTGLNYDLGWGLRLPFETIYGYAGVLALMWLFIVIVYWMRSPERMERVEGESI